MTKRLFVTLIFFSMAFAIVSAQGNEEKRQESVITDTIPTYPGGYEAYKKFIKRNLRYPDYCSQFRAEGQCTMIFVVESNGNISNISAKSCKITYIDPGTISHYSEEEAKAIKKECARQMAKEGLRVIRKMKPWNPGYKNGVPVRLIHALNLSFSVNYVDDEL